MTSQRPVAIEEEQLAWDIESETGTLRDVLLCRPTYYRWLPTSPISRATLESGKRFEPDTALTQHDEMVSAYHDSGVHTHFLDEDPALPYQVFTRASSAMTSAGAVITQMNQWWRRGEYCPATRFYQANGIPIRGMITAAALEGGDVIMIEPGVALIGHGEERTQGPAARQLGTWLEADGWEVRIEPIPGHFVHIDVLVSILAPRLSAVCVDAASSGLVRWLHSKKFEIIDVSIADAMGLGVNAIALGEDRVLTAAGSTLARPLRARGIDVIEPNLTMFTLGGGGAHCLAQPLRRERTTS